MKQKLPYSSKKNVLPSCKGPSFWGLINPDWRLCNQGRRQSPVDLDPEYILYDPNLKDVHITETRVSWKQLFPMVYFLAHFPYSEFNLPSGGAVDDIVKSAYHLRNKAANLFRDEQLMKIF